jgi:hypothetical protein
VTKVTKALYPTRRKHKWLWELIEVDKVREVAMIETSYGVRGILYSDVAAALKGLNKVKAFSYNIKSGLTLSSEIKGHTFGCKIMDGLYRELSHVMGRMGKGVPFMTSWKCLEDKDSKILLGFLEERLALQDRKVVLERFGDFFKIAYEVTSCNPAKKLHHNEILNWVTFKPSFAPIIQALLPEKKKETTL